MLSTQGDVFFTLLKSFLSSPKHSLELNQAWLLCCLSGDQAEMDHLRRDVDRMRSTLESCKGTIQMLESENHQLKSTCKAERRKSQVN